MPSLTYLYMAGAGDPTSGIFLHPGEPAGHCSSYLTECGLSNTQLGLVGAALGWWLRAP